MWQDMFPTIVLMFLAMTSAVMIFARKVERLSSRVVVTFLTVTSIFLAPVYEEFLRGHIRSRIAILLLALMTIGFATAIRCAVKDFYAGVRAVLKGDSKSIPCARRHGALEVQDRL